MYELHFDGLYRQINNRRYAAAATAGGHAGFMCYGWLIYHNGALVARGHGVFAHSKAASSNSAEYLALIEGLEALADMGVCSEPVMVIGDAKSVLDQMSGDSAVNSEAARSHYRRARKLVRQFENMQWCWTPREHNRAADMLTRKAMSRIRQAEEEYRAALEAMFPARRGKPPARGLLAVLDFRVYNTGAGLVQ